jgi:dynein heavy chain 1
LKLSIVDDEEDEYAYTDNEKQQAATETAISTTATAPSWMKQLNVSVSTWLTSLPKQIHAIKRSQENIKDPLFRFFEREINSAISLLTTVQSDLNDVSNICDGNKKQTNYHRQLLKDLAKGLIPPSWRRYVVPKNLIVQAWIVDFAERIKQLARVSQTFEEQGLHALRKLQVWLGGLFTPEAYITATRQLVAQTNSWSLEELSLNIQVYDENAKVILDESSFAITGLKLQGAVCENNRIKLSSDIVNDLSVCVIQWSKQDRTLTNKQNTIVLPIYLNLTRSELLFKIEMATDQNEKDFFMRGIAILASNIG